MSLANQLKALNIDINSDINVIPLEDDDDMPPLEAITRCAPASPNDLSYLPILPEIKLDWRSPPVLMTSSSRCQLTESYAQQYQSQIKITVDVYDDYKDLPPIMRCDWDKYERYRIDKST